MQNTRFTAEPDTMDSGNPPLRHGETFPRRAGSGDSEQSTDPTMMQSLPDMRFAADPRGLHRRDGSSGVVPDLPSLAAVAASSYQADPTPGLKRRKTFFMPGEEALYGYDGEELQRAATRQGMVTPGGAPVRRDSRPVEVPPTRRPSGEELDTSAWQAGFKNFADFKAKVSQYLPSKPARIETGGNVLATIGALVDNKPMQVAGTALTGATALDGLYKAWRAEDKERMALNAGHLGVMGVNVLNIFEEHKGVAAAAGLATVAVNSYEGYLDKKEQAKAAAMLNDVEMALNPVRRDSGPSGSATAAAAGTSTGMQRQAGPRP
ncbi:hypothetical protein [Micromonospora sp. SH-82]|uniref:hypothetical protein n=1 Tax=Micromonospora sp. SH-82 TaxID=3132938 RepID=UPI003EC0A095